MKSMKFILSVGIPLFFICTISSCNEVNQGDDNKRIDLPTISKDELENQVWRMEEKYWEYVQNIDTSSYKDLWHEDFIGYPSFGDGVSSKNGIAVWIPELHKDPNSKFSYQLYKRAVNAIDDIVIAFYDADEIWTDIEGQVVRKERFKFTHTWKKYDNAWVILGGMAAKKNQDILNN